MDLFIASAEQRYETRGSIEVIHLASQFEATYENRFLDAVAFECDSWPAAGRRCCGRTDQHLAGRWTMAGTLGGKQIIHDVEATWVLKHEYIQFHEVSRERSGGPGYEAIVYLGWHVKTNEFMCLRLDNTAGGGLSPEGIAHGTRSGTTIPLVFTLSTHESLHTTFAYDPASHTWRLTIDDVTDGKSERFGDVQLSYTR